MDVYRKPYLQPGEDRRPTLTWARNVPISAEPADVHSDSRSQRRVSPSEPSPAGVHPRPTWRTYPRVAHRILPVLAEHT
jgi:hypothetical protein